MKTRNAPEYRRVKVRYSFELEIDVPADSANNEIEFYRNDGTWCAGNALDELRAQADKHPDGCLCAGFKMEVLS